MSSTDTTSNVVNALASELLVDIEVAYGYARPVNSRRIFQSLQPHYSYATDENLVDRLVTAFEALDDEKKELFRLAVREALARCATVWLGAIRTLAVADLAVRIARELLPSDIWTHLLERSDPTSPATTAVWLERLVRALGSWGIQIRTDRVNWSDLVRHSDTRALPFVAEWVLRQLRHDPERSKPVYGQITSRIRDEEIALLEHWPVLEDVWRRIEDAFLCGLSLEEKEQFVSQQQIVEQTEWSFSGITGLVREDAADMELEGARSQEVGA